MTMSEARERLRATQKLLTAARQTRDKISNGRARADAIVNGIRAEMDSLDELERAETSAAVDAIKNGTEPPKPTAKKSAYEERLRLEARQRNMNDVVDTLDEQLAEAEAAVVTATTDEDQAREGVLAARTAIILAKALELEAEKRALLPELNIAVAMNLKVDGLRNFVLRPAQSTAHELPRPVPDVVSASAMLRAWKMALEFDPTVEPSTEMGAALEAAEAAAQAARDAAEREEEEKYQAEREALRREAQRKYDEERGGRDVTVFRRPGTDYSAPVTDFLARD